MSGGQAGRKLGTSVRLSPAGPSSADLSTERPGAGDGRPPVVPVSKPRVARIRAPFPGINKLYDYNEV